MAYNAVNSSKINTAYLRLSYATSLSGTYTEIEGLQDFPGLKNDRDTVETTCFSDDAHVYIAGIKNFGDSLSFTIVHDTTNFGTYNTAFDGTTQYFWKVEIPDDDGATYGVTATFKGSATIGIASVGVNSVVTDTLKIIPSTGVTFT